MVIIIIIPIIRLRWSMWALEKRVTEPLLCFFLHCCSVFFFAQLRSPEMWRAKKSACPTWAPSMVRGTRWRALLFKIYYQFCSCWEQSHCPRCDALNQISAWWLISPTDESKNGHVIWMFYDDVIVRGWDTVGRTQGEEFGAEAAALQGSCADRELSKQIYNLWIVLKACNPSILFIDWLHV